ncbi:MAG: metallophosphoesterase, partial [Victivallales bacterium]|nr:metallophosphoesterase [Victivallales bacterium]
TGDLTSTGQPGEFAKVRAILKRLVATGMPFFFVPGNHDYYVRRPKCVNYMKEMVEYLTGGRYTFSDLPVQLQVGELDFIIVNESWPSNLLSSHGVLKPATSRFVAEVCARPAVRPRVIIGHYPLIEDHPLLRLRHRLFGQKEVVGLLREGNIALSLCGHVHKPYLKVDGAGRGEVCAGSVTRNGCMAEIEYDPARNSFTHRRITL